MSSVGLTPPPGPIAGPPIATAAPDASDKTQITGTVVATSAAPIAALSVEQIAELFEIAESEVDAIQQLDDSVASLHEVRRAKALLRQVPPVKIRAGLELRAAVLRGEST